MSYFSAINKIIEVKLKMTKQDLTAAERKAAEAKVNKATQWILGHMNFKEKGSNLTGGLHITQKSCKKLKTELIKNGWAPHAFHKFMRKNLTPKQLRRLMRLFKWEK
jgi:hypothetical protein